MGADNRRGMTVRPVVLISGVDPTAGSGGHQSYVRAHALAASTAGFEPHVFCISERAGIERTDFGVLHRVRSPVRHLLLAPVFPAAPRALAEATVSFVGRHDDGRRSLIHGFGLWGAAAVRTSAALARSGIEAPVIVSAYMSVVDEWRGVLRGLTPAHGIRAISWYVCWYPWVRTVVNGVEGRGITQARLVLVNYEEVERDLRALHGDQAVFRRITYAAPAAFASRRDVAAVPDGLPPGTAPLIVSVSRHDARKGLDKLLRALARLQAAGIEFRACLLGPGRLLEAHRMLADRLGLTDCVTIPGRVESVEPYLRAADVFVLPSLQEGSGSVAVLEALRAQLAIVASACDGILEDIVDGESGLLVPPGDVRTLAAALATLVGDARLRRQLERGAGELYRRRFSAPAFVEALRSTYAEVGVTP
jgi:glycosyltransferase involved in cell wall biosynthesis